MTRPVMSDCSSDLVKRLALKLRMNALILGDDEETVLLLKEAASKTGEDMGKIILDGASLPEVKHRALFIFDVTRRPSLFGWIKKIKKIKHSHNSELRIIEASIVSERIKSIEYQVIFESNSEISSSEATRLFSHSLVSSCLSRSVMKIKRHERFAPSFK